MDFAHLRAEAAAVAMLPAIERIALLEVDHWIGYTAAQQALAELARLIAHQPGRIRPHNLMIIGPTNNGKTMVAERFRRLHPSRTSDDGGHEIIPAVMIQMPADPTIGRLTIAILTALGSPILHLSAVDARQRLAFKLLDMCETRMLIIDEFHNLLGVSARRQRELLNHIRFIGNDRQLPIVGLGTREAWLAIRSDPQLENRFTPYLLPLWDDGVELGRLLASFETCLPLREPSHLASVEMRALVLRRAEGTIGEIATLITRAARTALLAGREHIDTAAIEAAGYDGPSVRRRLVDRALK